MPNPDASRINPNWNTPSEIPTTTNPKWWRGEKVDDLNPRDNLLDQEQELVARVLKLHARWKVADPDTYTEAIAHLDVLVTVATDMADSLHERLWEREEARRN